MRKGLPKKYAKMGFKKGWKAYKSSRFKTKKVLKTITRRVSNVARKTKSKKRQTGTTFKAVGNALIGTGIAVIYEVVISPMIPLQTMVKNVIELAVGVLLAVMKQLPMPVRSFGLAMAVINTYALATPYVQNLYAGSG